MPTDVRVPTTGNAGEDAVVLEWSVAEGDEVAAGDLLVTLETAKATIEVGAPTGGRVSRILAAAGDEVPEHEVLAIIGSSDAVADDPSDEVGPATASDDAGGTAPAAPTPGVVLIPTGTGGAERRGAATGASSADGAPAARVSASPRAKVLAARRGLDLGSVRGTGPGGRIVIADVQAVVVETPASASAPPGTPVPAPAVPAPAAAAPTAVTPPASASDGVVPAPAGQPARLHATVAVRGARKVTAQRMHASLQDGAQVTLTRYASGDALTAYARRLREVTEAQGRPRIGVNDLLLFAAARTLARHPEANSWFAWEGIRQFSSVDLGFAVDTGQALLVPVIRDADALSLGELAAAARAAVEKARAGRLSGEEMQGGTFTVSNLGGLGVHWFTPVLNPPQTCILGVGALHRSHPQAPELLPLSLTFDHRAIDGAAAAVVLADIAAALETIDVLVAL